MAIEFVDHDTGTRRQITRGWVVLILSLAAWGLVSVAGLAIYGVFRLFV